MLTSFKSKKLSLSPEPRTRYEWKWVLLYYYNIWLQQSKSGNSRQISWGSNMCVDPTHYDSFRRIKTCIWIRMGSNDGKLKHLLRLKVSFRGPMFPLSHEIRELIRELSHSWIIHQKVSFEVSSEFLEREEVKRQKSSKKELNQR